MKLYFPSLQENYTLTAKDVQWQGVVQKQRRLGSSNQPYLGRFGRAASVAAAGRVVTTDHRCFLTNAPGMRFEIFLQLGGCLKRSGFTVRQAATVLSRYVVPSEDWRRGDSNPCPRRYPRRHLHVYPALKSEKLTSHRRAASFRASASSILRIRRGRSADSLSLLSPFPPLAGVAAKTSRSIKPRERDLRDLRLFVLVRFLTRPTDHPRHAACASNDESKPVRPRPWKILSGRILCKLWVKIERWAFSVSNPLRLPNVR